MYVIVCGLFGVWTSGTNLRSSATTIGGNHLQQLVGKLTMMIWTNGTLTSGIPQQWTIPTKTSAGFYHLSMCHLYKYHPSICYPSIYVTRAYVTWTCITRAYHVTQALSPVLVSSKHVSPGCMSPGQGSPRLEFPDLCPTTLWTWQLLCFYRNKHRATTLSSRSGIWLKHFHFFPGNLLFFLQKSLNDTETNLFETCSVSVYGFTNVAPGIFPSVWKYKQINGDK